RRQQADWYLLLLEFWTYAARDDRLRRAFAARHNQLLQQVAQALERKAAAMGQKLALSAMDLARAGSAMGHGAAVGCLGDPERVPGALLETMLLSIIRSASFPAPHRKRGWSRQTRDRQKAR